MEQIINDYEKLHHLWKDLINKENLIKVLKKIPEQDFDDLMPKPNDIFNAFKFFTPDYVKIVIIGQDPYPTDAVGLAFAKNSDITPPTSIKKIVGALENSKIIKTENTKKITANISFWAAQGVLLYNIALTTLPKNNINIWADFSKSFLNSLSEFAKNKHKYLTFFAWGGDANELLEKINIYDHEKYNFTHPAARENTLPVEKHFKNCPHFMQTKDIVNWNLAPKIDIFTDGSSKPQGSGFASIFYIDGLKKVKLYGKVRDHEYILKDAYKKIEDIFIPQQPKLNIDKSINISATNNRAELLGIIYGLLLISWTFIPETSAITILSDSKISVKTITEWYPSRKREGTEDKLKNLDLLIICDKLLRNYKKYGFDISFKHINSHTKMPNKGSDEYFIWSGNEKADKYAKKGGALKHSKVKLSGKIFSIEMI